MLLRVLKLYEMCRYIHYYDRVFNSREDLTAVQSINLFSLRISGLPVSMQKRIVLAVWVRPPGKDKRILTLSRVTYLGNTGETKQEGRAY